MLLYANIIFNIFMKIFIQVSFLSQYSKSPFFFLSFQLELVLQWNMVDDTGKSPVCVRFPISVTTSAKFMYEEESLALIPWTMTTKVSAAFLVKRFWEKSSQIMFLDNPNSINKYLYKNYETDDFSLPLLMTLSNL